MKPNLDKAGYPKEWQNLEAKDFCRKAYAKGSRYCMEGWLNRITRGNAADIWLEPVDKRDALRNYIRKAAIIFGAKNPPDRDRRGFCAVMSDDRDNSLPLLAHIWNLAGAMLGYVVSNPETKTLKKMQVK